MSGSDLFARCAAVAISLFVASFLMLSLIDPFWPKVPPFQTSLVLVTLSVSLATLPLVLVHLMRVAMGDLTGDRRRAAYFFWFTLLLPIFAVLIVSLLFFGQIHI